jgi:hypothetical protein
MFNLQMKADYDFRWISHIRSVFDRTGLGYIFRNQIQIKTEALIIWASRGHFYATFKIDFFLWKLFVYLSLEENMYQNSGHLIVRCR